MTATVLTLAILLAGTSMVLAWREGRRRLNRLDYYIAPITLFRRELSLAGIATIAAVIVWASYMPGSVRFAGIALFPVFLYVFMVLRRPDR